MACQTFAYSCIRCWTASDSILRRLHMFLAGRAAAAAHGLGQRQAVGQGREKAAAGDIRECCTHCQPAGNAPEHACCLWRRFFCLRAIHFWLTHCCITGADGGHIPLLRLKPHCHHGWPLILYMRLGFGFDPGRTAFCYGSRAVSMCRVECQQTQSILRLSRLLKLTQTNLMKPQAKDKPST